VASHQCDGNKEPLDQGADGGSEAFFAQQSFHHGKLWGIANQEARFAHHGNHHDARIGRRWPQRRSAAERLAYQALSVTIRTRSSIPQSLRCCPTARRARPSMIRGACMPADWA